MPHTQFSLDQVCEYLHLSEGELRDLVKCGQIPHHTRGGEAVFIREEIDSWASLRVLRLNDKHMGLYHKKASVKAHDLSQKHEIMSELIREDWIEPLLPSRTKASVLKDLCSLAEQTGRVVFLSELAQSLNEREALASTAMAGGFALVHPRNHDPYMFEDSFLVLARSPNGIPFGAPDGFKTNIFFLICCQDDRIHLHVLARLCMMCNHTHLLDELHAAESREEMMNALHCAEAEAIRYL